MRFLLDENIHHGLLSFLASLGHDATLSPKGLSNGAVLALAKSEARILITHDDDFAAPLTSAKNAGIVLVKIPSRRFTSLKEAIRQLLVTHQAPEQLREKVIVLFEDRWDEFP